MKKNYDTYGEACRKDNPPYHQKCDNIWNKAVNAVPCFIKRNQFKKSASVIEITEAGWGKFSCYNRNNWKDNHGKLTKGWCKVERAAKSDDDTNFEQNGWGICSPSCKFYGNNGKDARDILVHSYHDLASNY